jgi:hypothetical protein
VFFIAERLTDAFLRKVRLLRIESLTCYEFRYLEVNGQAGFYLDVVDWQRKAAAPPPTSRPLAVDVHDESEEPLAGGASPERPRSGPPLPPLLEAGPVGGPDRFRASRPPTAGRSARVAQGPDPFDEEHVRAVRDYLQRELPDCTIYDFHDLERSAQAFQIHNHQGRLSRVVLVAGSVFDGRNERDIRKLLEQHRLAGALRDAGPGELWVTSAGLHPVSR